MSLPVLVTRPEPGAGETAGRLRALGLVPVVAPLMEMTVLHPDLPAPGDVAALALTSANALRAMQDGDRLRAFAHLPAFAVGARTADEARRRGFADVTATGGGLAGLVEAITAAAPGGPVFYPATTTPSGDLAAALAPHGIRVVTAPVYDMRPLDRLPAAARDLLSATGPAAITLYSRRSAALFAELVAGEIGTGRRGELTMLCLSENAAQPVIGKGFGHIALAEEPSEEAMMTLALSFARQQIR